MSAPRLHSVVHVDWRVNIYGVHLHGLGHYGLGPLTLNRRSVGAPDGHHVRTAALWLGRHCLASVANGGDGLAVSVGNSARMLRR